LDSLDSTDTQLREGVLSDVLSGGVSSFDGFGKCLKGKYAEVFQLQPKNLFQNLALLSSCIEASLGTSISMLVGEEEFTFLVKWFQVRHLYEHNMGVVDEDFVKKVKGSGYLKGKKYQLDRKEIEKVLDLIKMMAEKIMSNLTNA